jgi:hypothetical protein
MAKLYPQSHPEFTFKGGKEIKIDFVRQDRSHQSKTIIHNVRIAQLRRVVNEAQSPQPTPLDDETFVKQRQRGRKAELEDEKRR